MIDFNFRASSLGEIMTDAKSIDPHLLTPELAAISRKKVKTDDEKELLQPLLDKSLSVGAKTVCEAIAKEQVYGFNEVISGKYMDKGIIVEDESIALYNSVFFTNYTKNKERKHNKWISGECDIFTGSKIIDIKSSWSLATFPATSTAGCDKGYEWQGRAYMMLWDVDYFDIAYCMVNTPDELIKYEQLDLHFVDHIAEELRVTIVPYIRDRALEEKIKHKVEAARKYMAKVANEIKQQHNILEVA
jgi:hypothetical protein